jgi:hypothetical protein
MSSDTHDPDDSQTPSTDGSDHVPDPAAPNPVPRPKRGAFPTPQSKIDEATPYVPEIDETD